MAEADEEMLCQQEVLQEQERLQEAEERRVCRMEMICQIADLERDRDWTTNRLRRFCNQPISRFNFTRMENSYIGLLELDSALSERISDWEDLLDTDESGNPTYPGRGQPEYRYSPEAEDFARKTGVMEEVLAESQETLKKFLIALPAAERVIVSLEARMVFLKNPNVWEAGYRVPQQNDQAEEEEVVLSDNQVSAGYDTPHAEEVVT